MASAGRVSADWGRLGPFPGWEVDLMGCRIPGRSDCLQHAAIDEVSGSNRVARPVRAQRDEEIRQLSRCREAVDRREKKCADQLIQLPPSAQATAPVLDSSRSKFAGPRSFERQESRMGFERRRNCELCASFSRLSNDNAPLEIEIGGQHDHVANRHAAWPRQHEHHHVRHFAGLQQTSRLPGFLQLLRRPVREQCADDGAGRD
jgi:hypothetical protein